MTKGCCSEATCEIIPPRLLACKVSTMQHRIQTGHADIGVDGADLDVMAKQLGDSTGGAFTGLDGFSGRVSELVEAIEESDPPESDGGNGATANESGLASGGSAAGAASTAAAGAVPLVPVKRQLPEPNSEQDPSKRTKRHDPGDFFDRDRSVMQAIRNAKAANSTVHATLRAALDKAQRDIANYSAQPQQHKQEFDGEHKILQSRVTCLALVLSGKPEELQQHLCQFKDTMTTSARLDMGMSPPCRSYKELVPIQFLDAAVEKFNNVFTKADLEQVISLSLFSSLSLSLSLSPFSVPLCFRVVGVSDSVSLCQSLSVSEDSEKSLLLLRLLSESVRVCLSESQSDSESQSLSQSQRFRVQWSTTKTVAGLQPQVSPLLSSLLMRC